LELQAAEAEVVSLEASAFAQALPEPSARARYAQLSAAAQAGAIPDELIGPLETMLELVFDTGRPTNRAVLQAVFARTPRGNQRAAAAREVSRALETLHGQSIVEVRLAAAGPSQQTLTIETDRCRVQVEFDRQGARVTSLETG
jgi:hypothetical protein